MQIGQIASAPRHYTSDDQPAESSPRRRGRREIDQKAPDEQQLVQTIKPNAPSQGGGYRQATVDPDPGKSVANSQKTPTPTNLGLNINVDPVTKEISKAFKSVEQEASDFLKRQFAQMKAQETDPAKKQKWDIDPDNTYLVTYDYNSEGKEPYPAKIIQRISLTEALIKNAQHTPEEKGYSVPFFEGGPNVHAQDSVKAHKPKFYDLPSRINPHSQNADITHSYQGIYTLSPGATSSAYNASNQSSVSPAEFKKLIWQADFQQPYSEFLDQFWSGHKEEYPVVAKAAFVKGAMAQHQEGSLTAEGRALVMRAAGLPGNQDSWPDIDYKTLKKNPAKDPNIEVGLLKIGDYTSTDLMYITDKKVTFDANGNKVPPLTLLYIPGNSSPIHSFNSPAEMRTWLAAQMADPLKRDAMASHFPLKDKPNGWERAGIDETLAGLGVWPEKRETPGGVFSYNHRAFSGKWDPQEFIKTEPTNLPFDEISKRQKDRSYSDAAIKITSDSDVTKSDILEGLGKVTKAALFLTPLALVVPEVALALDAFYLADSAITTGIGVDDSIQGKSAGTDRIVFGLFNAATVVVPKILRKIHKTTLAETKIFEHPTTPRANQPAPASAEVDRPLPDAQVNNVNRLSPSQSGTVSEFAVADAETLIKNIKPNASGIYQVKGSQGEDRWFIKYADDTHVERVYEIDERFKLRDGYVQIIDPSTRKPVVRVHSTNDGLWVPINGPGGIKLPWNSSAASNATRQLDSEIEKINKEKTLFTEAERQQFSDDLTKLGKESRAEEYQTMTRYEEAGSDEINNVLRTQSDPNLYPKRVKNFLSDLKLQRDFQGRAYRYAQVTPEGAAALKKGVGKVFRDSGVQSASTQPSHAKAWDTWGQSNVSAEANKPVIYVFDESVPKKNLSMGALDDQVLVPPEASLEVLATKEKDGILYVSMGAATKMPKQRFNLFDGSVARPF